MKEVYVNSEHINTLETFLDLTPIVCGPIYLFILLLYKVLVHHLMRICARFLSCVSVFVWVVITVQLWQFYIGDACDNKLGLYILLM